MNKNIKLGLSLITLFVIPLAACNSSKTVESNTFHVDFYNNYLREDFTLSDDFSGKGNNLIYKSVEVEKNTLLAKPEDPTRSNYDFVGWYKEKDCLLEWDFTKDLVESNLRLYAKWVYGGQDEIVEPEYTPPSTRLDSGAPYNYIVNSVMNFKIVSDMVRLSQAALDKLEASKDNVLPLMEYKVKDNLTASATYDGTNITFTCGSETKIIRALNAVADYKMSNSSYEDKAKKYEANALLEESYHVMLAGSSSIEFWETYKEDLAPIVAYNHGIGGTTIEEWTGKLNQRLVYPYKPKMVVYYVGINNVINSKEPADTIITRITDFFDSTHAAMPNTKIQYILMNLLPGYPGYVDVINSVNSAVIKYQSTHKWLTLINPGLDLLKTNKEMAKTYQVDDYFDVRSNIGLMAQWEDLKEGEIVPDEKYTVSFNVNGGTGSLDSVPNVKGDYSLPVCPFTCVETKYFAGWRVNGQGKDLAPGTVIKVYSNTEIVAHWKFYQFKVTFDTNGASENMESVIINAGDYRLPSCSAKAPAGMRFAGWLLNGETSLLAVNAKVRVMENIKLTAQWEAIPEPVVTYVITMNANDGSEEPVTSYVGGVCGAYALPDCDFDGPTGKYFSGWKINNAGEELTAGTTVMVNEDLVLYAQWNRTEPEPEPEQAPIPVPSYTVCFMANGGTGSMPYITEVFSQYKLPGCPFEAPAGKKFAGWKIYGDPNAAFFRTDGLHLSYYGYIIWGGIIKDSIVDGLNKK